MRGSCGNAWWTLALGAGLIIGCGTTRPPYPEDPLLVGRRPVVAKADVRPPARVASVDPVPPPVESEALAHLPLLPGRTDEVTPGSRPPLQAFPAARQKE